MELVSFFTRVSEVLLYHLEMLHADGRSDRHEEATPRKHETLAEKDPKERELEEI
jgi:hypothetical protein